MRLNFIPMTISLWMAAQAASASPESDADFIASYIMSDDLKLYAHEFVKNSYARELASELRERSVRVIDYEGFAELLPDELADPHVERIQMAAKRQILQAMKPESLERLADYLRNRPLEEQDAPDAIEDEPVTLKEFTQELSRLVEDEKFKNEITDQILLMHSGVALLALMMSETQSIEAELNAPYMAEILETDGVFTFPNRIVRKDLIREIRAASQ